MAVAIAAGIAAVAGLAGSAMSSNAAGSAAGVQAGALNNATGLQAQMYQQGQQNLAPYIGSGTEAQGELDTLLGIQNPAGPGGNNYRVPTSDASNPAFLSTVDPFYSAYGGFAAADAPGSAFQQLPAAQQQQINQAATSAWGAAQPSQSSAPGFGSLLQPFTSADLNANMAPNYEFSLQQGQGANENLANASGGLIGGNAMQGLDTFTQNYAQGAYQQAYQNYNTNLSNIYSRLSGVANQGESAAAGAATNALTAGAQMAGTTAASGAATAGGIIGSANAISGGLNNAGSTAMLGGILNNNSTTATEAALTTLYNQPGSTGLTSSQMGGPDGMGGLGGDQVN